ncbi:aldo/keto reductase [Aestuariibacter sp. AA17]|uniref:Aldo/keto reductase n=1 Tax=Fluctibacter corallii TaxID=2984329 RepID=A0ABT3A7D7_9ALTE|nr:aldo/keto reductase [Aestuariibacter sp. AA17]MCV2884525.1 aldo/keto reductase [Aestuariibacter sp. AA17]
MEYNPLGSSGLKVSRVCLGSMTWGTQNNQREANEQIEYAISQGVNFIDTAEMYSIPPDAESYGKTETIIGNWLAENVAQREQLVLATKIAGPGLDYIRGGEKITAEGVKQAVDASLKRLQTDYIDVYQLHWPNRTTPHFGKHAVGHVTFSDASSEQEVEGMLDILNGLDACIKAGKIRHWGLSDDTPWGISQYLRLAEKHSLPKMVSIQNEFSLVHTKDWPYLIEQCIHDDIAYLPWSPLAGGMLSGKYLKGARPAGSRWTMSQRMGLFRNTPQSEAATTAYVKLASKNHMSAAQLALAWCNQVDGVTSTIIGATSMAQLKENITAFESPLSEDVLQDVQGILATYPVPY